MCVLIIIHLHSSFISTTFTLLTFSVPRPMDILLVRVASTMQAVSFPQAAMTVEFTSDKLIKVGLKEGSGSGAGETNRDELLSFTLPKEKYYSNSRYD